jgi:hypothetical protein
MRTIKTIAAAAALLLASAASAQGIKGTGKYGTAGCGLGSLAFSDQSGGIQILAATTNGTSWNQLFGITSGTSNCQPGAFAMGTKNFVDANREVLAKDAARGEGDAIGAIAVINECKDPRAVGAALQRDFRTIFPSTQATNEQVTEAILRTLHSDPALGCGRS